MKKPTKKALSKEVDPAIGIETDAQGNKLRPGHPILYWVGGDGPEGMRPWPGYLSMRMHDRKWAIVFNQRMMPGFNVTPKYSPVAKIGHWTFVEAYDDFDSK